MVEKTTFSLKGKRIWVAGHSGMVGSSIVRRLQQENCSFVFSTRQELDLRRQSDVEAWMSDNAPDVAVVAAATVGGIHANNSRPAEFISDNLNIATSIIQAAHKSGVEKLLYLGSACLYPRLAPQPMSEEALLTGPLEPTNEWYAIAKIAGIKICQAYRRQYGCDFIVAQPSNIYGPGDDVDLKTCHVIPALITKAHEAKQKGLPSIGVWGSGKPKREFLFIDDAADALVFLLKNYSDENIVNVGSSIELTIAELAHTISKVVGFEGRLEFDTSKPDGMPRRLLDTTKLQGLGWLPKTTLEDGLRETYGWYLNNM